MFASTLDTNIEFLKGVGPKRAELLQKELGVFTCEQLLSLYPFRYIDRTRFYKVNELNEELPYVQILGRITAKEEIGEKHKKRIVAKLSDETGVMELVWFQSFARCSTPNSGVNASQVSTKGMGEANPIASNDTEEGRIQNRRVESSRN